MSKAIYSKALNALSTITSEHFMTAPIEQVVFAQNTTTAAFHQCLNGVGG